jgi:hypothetical protein
MQAAARTLGLQVHVLHASTEQDFDKVFADLAQLRAGALVISPDVFFNTRSEQLAALSLRHAVPAIYQYREFAASPDLYAIRHRVDEHGNVGRCGQQFAQQFQPLGPHLYVQIGYAHQIAAGPRKRHRLQQFGVLLNR